MIPTELIKVTWNLRIDGRYSAIAEEEKAGYNKGEVVAIIRRISETQMFPGSIHVLPKSARHEV